MDTLLSTTRTLFSKSSLNSLLAKKPLKPRSFTRPSLLFIPGSSSLAHLGRLLTLAQTLPSDIGDIHFACDSYLRHYVPKPFCWQPAGSLSGDEMRQRLKRGQTLLDEDSVRHQVEEDLALLRSVQPTVVVGDFRPSLSISAALAKVPYVNVVNAHWSPWANILFESAGALDAWWARPWGPRLGKRLTDVMLPLGLRIQARPFNRVRRSYGLPPLTNDLRHIYTAGDVVAYTDLEGWVPTPGAPRMHRHIGPVLWEPPMDLPAWWNTVKTDRPCVFVSVGSTGQWDTFKGVVEALRHLPVVALVATSGRGHIEPVPGHIYVEDYLPGEAACRRSDLVICNGGAGLVYQSLQSGVPVLGIASNVDQMLVMRTVQDQRLGQRLPVGLCAGTDWAKTITCLLNSTELKNRTRREGRRLNLTSSSAAFHQLLKDVIEMSPSHRQEPNPSAQYVVDKNPVQPDKRPHNASFDYGAAFSRNLGLVDSLEQNRLKHSVVAIAGLGGVGGVHLTTLARLGIGGFHIADLDSFEVQNFNRQTGAAVSTLGRPKIDVMAERLLDINPSAQLRSFDKGISPATINAFLHGVDVVVDGLDFFAVKARELLFDEAQRRGIPLITAGPIGMSVAWLIFKPGSMPWRDYFAFDLAKTKFEKYLLFALGLTPQATQMSYLDRTHVNLEEHRGPSMALAVELCAGVAAAEVLKLILGRGPVQAAPHYRQFDAYKGKLVKGQLHWGNRGWLQRLKAFFFKHYLMARV